MPTPSTLLLFSGAALILLVIPGPAVLYIVARSATQGLRAGLVSIVGIHTGTLVHVAAAVAGLSAVVVASATAFTAIKLAGAAYLVYLGIQTLRQRGKGDGSNGEVSAARSMRRIFTDGVVLNVLNPKTAVFFLAFVPQFVNVDAGNATTQLLVLGMTFIILGLLSDGAYAVAAGWVGDRVSTSSSLVRRKDLVAGITYISLGVVTAVSGRSSSTQ